MTTTDTTAQDAVASANSPRQNAPTRVVLLSGALACGFGAFSFWISRQHAHANLNVVPWWVFAGAFVITGVAVVNVEVHREVHVFTFSEIPLAVALFFVSPLGLIAGRVVGELVVLLWRVRNPRKVLFNLCLFACETAAALAAFHALIAHPNIANPVNWLAAFGAVLVADAIGWSAVSLVIRWHGGDPDSITTLLIGCGTAFANTSLALAAGLLLRESGASVVLLGALVGVLYVAYSGYSALVQRYASLQLLYDFTRALNGAKRAESVLGAILGQARKALRCEIAEIVLLSNDENHPCVRMRSDREFPVATTIGDPDAPFFHLVVEEREVLLAPRQTKRGQRSELLNTLGVRDLVVAPLFAEEGVVGYLLAADRMGEVSTFDSSDARLLETLANHAGVALENGRLVERVAREVREREYQAAHDALTGLPNRTTFVAALSEALENRGQGNVAVLLMDLDRFKDINDTLGHDTGDEVLCHVASRLVTSFQDVTISRLGGDEFAILLPHATDEAAAVEFANTARSVLLPPYVVRDVTLEVVASIGITIAPLHGDDANTLMKRADIAMYSAKREPSGVQVYDAETDENTVQRLALVGALREAIENDELQVYYQPKVRVCDEAVVGAEALVRWFHPEHGFMSPEVFVAIAERTGLIGGLTRLVARRAMAQCKEWNDRGHDLCVAVNLSAVSLLDSQTPDLIGEWLAESGLNPANLTIEITETTVMEPARSVAAIERLAALGLKLSIDDFGTGYSSLSYLQKLPVHEIKIDRSFVMTMAVNESDAAIVKSIVDLAHNLNLQVVAEGVEDRVSWDRLANLGCDIAQGYFMSRPIPADAFSEWLGTWEPKRIAPIANVVRAVSAIGQWR